MKLKSYNILFRLLSFLSDRTNGASLLVKYKIAIGTVILGITGASCTPKQAANSSTSDNDSISKINPTEIFNDSDDVIMCYDGPGVNPSSRRNTKFTPPIIGDDEIDNEEYISTCYSYTPSYIEDALVSIQIYKYGTIDVSPVSPEGDLDSFREWVQSNIKYPDPEIMLSKELEGKVEVSFMIDTEGNLIDKKIVKSLSREADNKVMSILSLSKPWTPGQHEGQVVNTEITLPITFSMSLK